MGSTIVQSSGSGRISGESGQSDAIRSTFVSFDLTVTRGAVVSHHCHGQSRPELFGRVLESRISPHAPSLEARVCESSLLQSCGSVARYKPLSEVDHIGVGRGWNHPYARMRTEGV
jgi:hypothetical protein